MKTITVEMAKALSLFQSKAPKIEMDSNVEFNKVKFNYATLGNILNTIRPIMKEAGLCVSQVIEHESNTIRTILICEADGSYIESSVPIKLTGAAKEIGALITYLRRYSIVSILGIIAEDDNDHEGTAVSEKAAPSEKFYKEAIERILAGEELILEKMLGAFTLNATQIRELVNAENLINE